MQGRAHGIKKLALCGKNHQDYNNLKADLCVYMAAHIPII